MNPPPFNPWRLPRFALLALAIVASGAGAAPRAEAANVVVTDDTGRRLTVPAPPLRIASLAPNVTAMLFAAGAGAAVVATTEYSSEPPAAQRIPRVGDANAIDLERLVALRPDVIVAWPGGENPAEIDRIGRLGIPIYRERVAALADLSASLRRLGALAGTREAANREAAAIDARIAALTHRYAGAQPVTALLQVWSRPIYTVGGPHLLTDALRVCGARNVFGDLRQLGPAVSTEAVIARDPQVIIAVAPRAESASWLAEWRRFPELRAVASGNLVAFPDQRLTRMGPGVLEATEELCKAVDAARARLAK
ncbi:MAG TPA: helical backbone metal receptor [Steroidobacteraceae bacterium]|nr:helical backbone metal receptor [Steroidobacteraceae bacterium]